MIVGTGKEALAALEKQKFELLFLDLQLPDITGDEIYAIAKAKYPTSRSSSSPATRTAT